jgi:hypothetical protein
MNQPGDSLIYEQSNRVNASMHILLRQLRKSAHFFAPSSISELLLQIEEATTPTQLNRVVNRLQKALWKLHLEEQKIIRQMAVQALMKHILSGPQEPLRLEAAAWLRLFVQSGMISDPIPVFVTLVTAYTRSSQGDLTGSSKEQHAYLKSIFDCFWPFRFPYPAYTREAFPSIDVFYPLAALLKQADFETQDALFGIFAELPDLDDPFILAHLLPLALEWASSPDPVHRQRSVYILRRMSIREAQEAIRRLAKDSDLHVRESANDVAGLKNI